MTSGGVTMTPWIQLERDLWLFNDGKLYWFDPSRQEEAHIAGSSNFPREVGKASKSERDIWLAAIENWQANSDKLRAIGDPLYQKASSFAAQIKAVTPLKGRLWLTSFNSQTTAYR